MDNGHGSGGGYEEKVEFIGQWSVGVAGAVTLILPSCPKIVRTVK